MRILLIFLCVLINNILGDDIILKPINNVNESYVYIHLQGQQISNEYYIDFCKSLQNVFNNAIWIGIPKYYDNTVNQTNINDGISRIVSDMMTQGMNKDSLFYIGGHGSAGMILQDYVLSDQFKALNIKLNGIVLLSSFLQRKYRQNIYPYNTYYDFNALSIENELDGVSRVTNFAEAYYHQQSMLHKYPIKIAMKTNFMSVTNDNITLKEYPYYVLKYDIKNETSNNVAHNEYATIIHEFMNNIAINQTNEMIFFKPIITSFLFEGNYNYIPPCYIDSNSTCMKGSNVINSIAQEYLVGNETTYIDYKTSIKDINSDTFSDIKTNNIPNIINSSCNTDNNINNCLEYSSTFTEAFYNEYNFIFTPNGTTFPPISAIFLASKLNSRQNIWINANIYSTSNNTNPIDICKNINQQIYTWAINTVSQTALNRFYTKSIPYLFGEDIILNDNIIWENTPLITQPISNACDGSITAIKILSPTVYNNISESISYQSCKLISPANVVEWIYVDSLPWSDGVNVTNPTKCNKYI